VTETVEVAAREQVDDLGVELRAARVVARRRSRLKAVREVARGHEQHVALELVGRFAHQPAEYLMKIVVARHREVDEARRVQEEERHEDAVVELVVVERFDVEVVEGGRAIEQTIEVKPSYGLTDEEVERMLLESFEHAEADVEARFLIEVRNEAETVLRATEKSLRNPDLAVAAMTDLAPGELAAIESALADLRSVMESNNRAVIEQKTRVLNDVTRHLAEVRILMERYAVADPTAGQSTGTFSSASAQQQYTKLLAQGTASVDAAYAASRTVEATDITDLKSASAGMTAPDVLQVYKNLLAGSQRHLLAFGG